MALVGVGGQICFLRNNLGGIAGEAEKFKEPSEKALAVWFPPGEGIFCSSLAERSGRSSVGRTDGMVCP